ncbi:hypothetical protein B0H67DRAFT_599005 [Lasiosphaeris hirsuta]|uniref:Dehydrogenase FUB6 n=1 Tax=Lasiosphaeris hirsuta TaxID=260670 RepID=A0AA40B1W6_9PEZI|nr:hypothetical protein B0H67DRAFT_599005 [Lasiosphaeris hirsuta]
MTNKTLIFKKIPPPLLLPIAGEHLVIEDRPFDLSNPPPPGGATVQVLYGSYDPYLRSKMRTPDVASFTPPFALDGPVTADAVARILQSASPAHRPGDLLLAHLPLAEYAVVSSETLATGTIVPGPRRVPPGGLGVFLGPLGMPGLTAWAGLYAIGKPKAGKVMFVSSAAGAVGQVAGQIAKREGLRVIGSVGNGEKLAFILDELKFDGGFNYNKERPGEALPRLAPEGIDIYFDNVGGEHLDAALENMNLHGRIVSCGMVSQYKLEQEERYAVKNMFLLLQNRLTMRGFLVYDEEFGPAHTDEHQEKLYDWLVDGSILAKLDITEGIENAAEGLINLLKGKNFGKAVLEIKRGGS